MDCRAVREDLVAYLDNELTPKQAAVMAGHLAVCPECARELQSLKAAWQALAAGDMPQLKPDFTADVLDRVRKESPAPEPVAPSPADSSDLPWGWVALVVVGIVVLIALCTAFLLGRSRPEVASVAGFDSSSISRLDGSMERKVEIPLSAPLTSIGNQIDQLSDQRADSSAQPGGAQVDLPVSSAGSFLKGPAKGSTGVPPVSDNVPPAIPVLPPASAGAVKPIAVRKDTDREIITNLELFENAEMLRDLEVVSEMEMLESMKESSS